MMKNRTCFFCSYRTQAESFKLFFKKKKNLKNIIEKKLEKYRNIGKIKEKIIRIIIPNIPGKKMPLFDATVS